MIKYRYILCKWHVFMYAFSAYRRVLMNKEVTQIRRLAFDCLDEGKKAYWKGNTEDSMALVEKAKSLFESIDDTEGGVATLSFMAIILGAIGNESMAVDMQLQTIDISRKHGYPVYEVLGLVNIGSAYQVIGAHEKAIFYFEKAEKVMMDHDIYKDEMQQTRVLGVYINLQDSYMALKQFDMVQKYIDLAKPIAQSMPDMEDMFFEFDIIESRLNWELGRKEKVYDSLERLMRCACNYTEVGNYIQNFTNLCDLLEKMNELDRWKQIIKVMEEYTHTVNVLDVRIFVNDMWMKWYKRTGDSQGYIQKCVEQVALYNQKKEDNNRDKEAAFDLRVALEKNEMARKEAKKQSDTDQLTGVYNRRKLREDIDRITSDYDRNVCVGIFDIDCFKEKNDTYGHLSGDDCLKTIANIINDVVKSYKGRTYRFGGDEFVVVIKDRDNAQIEQLAGTIKSQLAQKAIPNINSHTGLNVTLSQGYKNSRLSESYDIRSLLDDADKILYRVKKSGRDSYIVE